MKFTILIPTFNNGVVIRSAIESILEQTVQDFEIFVISDGAPQATHDVVQHLAAEDSRIRLFKFPKGERHGEAWRDEALREADSDAVAYLSDDDFWFPDHLKVLGDLLSAADFAHTRHAAITPSFEIHHIADQLTNPAIRQRMISEKVNIFNFSVPGHRLDAYRRLPVGWSPAPRDLWTDLHMWRKWLVASGMRYASSPVITSLHFSRGARMENKSAVEPEVWFWRELFRDRDMIVALRSLTLEGSKPVPVSAVLAAARDLRDPNGETATRLSRRLAAVAEELDRMRATRTWRYTQPFRNVWAKIRPARGGAVGAPLPVVPPAPPTPPPNLGAEAVSLAPPDSDGTRVHVHTVSWNDMRMLPYFFRHYEPWVEHFYFFDDGSTDGTREYLESRPDVTVATTPRSHPESWVLSAQTIHNSGWRRSVGKADWVVVTNVDEHLYHPDIKAYLACMRESGVTAIPSPGFEMVAHESPAPESLLCHDYTRGAPHKMYSRIALFRPDCIKATNYGPGRHAAGLQGHVVFPDHDEVLNLHYKYLGLEQTLARQTALGQKLGEGDKANNWGGQYRTNAADLDRRFEKLLESSVDVTKVTAHSPDLCWWRKQD